MKSITMQKYLGDFKAAAAEGAVVELFMRLVAGKVPAMRSYAHTERLVGIEDELLKHFDDALTEEEKTVVRLCRELRNKVLHTDFRAARNRLNKLGIDTPSGEVRELVVEEMTPEGIMQTIMDGIAGTKGRLISDTQSTGDGGVFGWFVEAGQAGDFKKAAQAFKRCAEIVERLALTENQRRPHGHKGCQ